MKRYLSIPSYSVEWDGKKMHYYRHEKPNYNPPLLKTIPLVAEYIAFWLKSNYPPILAIILFPFIVKLGRKLFKILSLPLP